jgi:hypothetical protein
MQILLLLLNSYSLWHRLKTIHARKTICRYEKKNSSANRKIFFLWFNRLLVVATTKRLAKTTFATSCSILYAVFFSIKNWRLSAWQIKRTRCWINRDTLWSMKIELVNWFSSISWQQLLISSSTSTNPETAGENDFDERYFWYSFVAVAVKFLSCQRTLAIAAQQLKHFFIHEILIVNFKNIKIFNFAVIFLH